MTENSYKAILLDRDGVVCKSLGAQSAYLTKLDQFIFLEGIHNLVTEANKKSYKIAVITNQPQISKGLILMDTLEQIHQAMTRELPQIDAVYFCPHVDSDNCLCRKPKPGLLL